MPFSIPFDGSYYDTIILVDGGFGDPEFPGGRAYGAAAFNHVHSKPSGAVVLVIGHRNTSQLCRDATAYGRR